MQKSNAIEKSYKSSNHSLRKSVTLGEAKRRKNVSISIANPTPPNDQIVMVPHDNQFIEEVKNIS